MFNRRTAIFLFIIMMLTAGSLLSGCSSVSGPVARSPFPDPFSAALGHTTITFVDLPASCTIEIYTLTGTLVRTLTETDGDAEHIWDVKNDAGEDVVSGVYNYVIKSSSGELSGKLTITN